MYVLDPQGDEISLLSLSGTELRFYGCPARGLQSLSWEKENMSIIYECLKDFD